VASWGAPLIALHFQLPALREMLLNVSLSGAAGTLSAMGEKGPQVRAGLARGLALKDPGASWHACRHGVAGLAGWITQVTAQTAKMGDDLCLMTQTGIAEVRLPAAGGSSTMPQKQNPVMPSLLVAIGRQAVGLNAVMQGAAMHRQQRDGAAWMSEWMTLPQMCLGLGRALSVATDLAQGMQPLPSAMARNIDVGTGLIYAEALSFRLAQSMPRPEAQAAVKALCAKAMETGKPLEGLARKAFPKADLTGLFTPAAQIGQAPAEARAFADAAARLSRAPSKG
jgi:3-carboxy-cis,cis-muconate cycloisomerase